MFGYIIRRLLMIIPIVVGVATITFFLLKLAPGDPALAFLGDQATPAMVANLNKSLGLDHPLVVQYLTFMFGLVHGNLGQSFYYRVGVSHLIETRLPTTLLLMLVSIVFAVVISVPLSLWAAVSKSTAVGLVVRLVTATVQGMPTFFIGTLLIAFVALKTGLFPVGGYGTTFPEQIRALVLPGLAVAVSICPALVRSLIASLNETLEAPFVEFASTKGLPRLQVIVGYALRNSSISAISVLGILAGNLVGGALVVENVFAIPGIGTLLLSSVLARDFPVVQALTVVFGILVVVIYLLTDIVYSLLDPRVRARQARR
jgi:peptide/nickel transport system permease protein